MSDIIILGKDGAASGSLRQKLEVQSEHVFTFDNAADTAETVKTQLAGDTVDTVNWIGHGNPDKLFLPGKKKLSAKEAAEFFESLGAKKIVLWSCNTGLRKAKLGLNNKLWDGYEAGTKNCKKKIVVGKGGIVTYKPLEKVGKDMRVEVTETEARPQIIGSFAYRVAERIRQVKRTKHELENVNVYAPPKSVTPGQIQRFDLEAGPLSHVQWKADPSKSSPTSISPSGRLQFMAVVDYEAEEYKIICKYILETGKFKFTYDCLYTQ